MWAFHHDPCSAFAAAAFPASTIKTILGILSAALSYAMKEELVTRNVVQTADRLYRPKPRAYGFLSPEDATKLIAAVEGSPYRNAYAVMLYCGLRANECLALRWQDVDLDRGMLRVEHSMVWRDGVRTLG